LEHFWKKNVRKQFSRINETWFSPLKAFHARKRWRNWIDKESNYVLPTTSEVVSSIVGDERDDFLLLQRQLKKEKLDYEGKTDKEMMEAVGYLPTFSEVQAEFRILAGFIL